jgi:E3 ubiquitin-protein ligase HUWE1
MNTEIMNTNNMNAEIINTKEDNNNNIVNVNVNVNTENNWNNHENAEYKNNKENNFNKHNTSTSSTTILSLNDNNDINNIYFNNILVKKIVVKSKYLNENINNYIFTYLKEKVEGICIDEGYIKPESVKIVKKSVGMLLGSRFTGDITYEVAYSASICNPVIGNIILCKVKFINKLGILANNGPLSIIIGRQIQKDEDFNNINIGDMIKVEVITKKFSLNDKEIRIIAKIWNENEKNSNKKNNKKEELISSDLTPILVDDNELGDVGVGIENENETVNSNENEFEDEYSLEEDDDDLINSDDDADIKMENPDEIELNVDEIELDDDKSEQEDDTEDYDDDNISVDYE